MAYDPIAGTWVVTYLQGTVPWGKYKYVCSAPTSPGTGHVQWRDVDDESESGTGTWTRSGQQVNFDWKDSATKEYLVLAPTIGGDKAAGAVRASYGNFTTTANRLDIVDPKEDLIQTWAANYGEFRSPHICPWAKPYTMMLPANHKLYNAKQMGGPIQRVRGLAVHTTWSDPGYSEEATVGICIRTWNAAGAKTGAHFIIGKRGDVGAGHPDQPYRLCAGRQRRSVLGERGDPDQGKSRQRSQIQSANILFQWVCNSLNVPRKLASGYVGKASENPNNLYAKDAKRSYDPVTRELCEAAGVPVTTSNGEAIASTGLSCHYWLNPVKPCPGTPLLRQMNQIVSG